MGVSLLKMLQSRPRRSRVSLVPSPALGYDAGMTYQSAGAVDACVAGVDAVEPLRLAELPEALFGHDGGRSKEEKLGG